MQGDEDAQDSPVGEEQDSGLILLGGHRIKPNWTPQEDLILLQHVAKHGTRHWASLQANGLLPLRDQKACCNRFILLKKRCIRDKKSLSHLLNRAKEAAFITTPASPLQTSSSAAAAAAAAGAATPGGVSLTSPTSAQSLGALSGAAAGLGVSPSS
jgi:hypothetical protein